MIFHDLQRVFNSRSVILKIVTLNGILLLAVVAGGCGGSSDGPHLPTIPVKGKLFVDDKPFGQCVIMFSPMDAESADATKAAVVRETTGDVKADGSFELG